MICVPWDNAGAYLRFSVTYLAKDERAEDALMEETVRTLGAFAITLLNTIPVWPIRCDRWKSSLRR